MWKNKLNKRYLQLSLYVIFTAIAIYILSLLAKGAPLIIGGIMDRLYWVFKVVKPIIIGFAFAYLMEPINRGLEKTYMKIKRIKKDRTARILAVLSSVAILILLISILMSVLVFNVTDQIRLASLDDIIKVGEEYVSNIDAFYQSVLEKLHSLDIRSDQLEVYFSELAGYVFQGFKGVINSLMASVSNISGIIVSFFFSFIVGIYLMIDGKMIMNYIRKIFFGVFNKKVNVTAKRIVNDLDGVFSGYIRGQLADASFMLLLVSLILSLLGVKFALLIGIFTGIGNLIPYMGPFVAYLLTTLSCVITGDYKTLFIAIIALSIVQIIDGNIIAPAFLGHSIKIHPLIVIISLIFGGAIGGLLGMLLAVPIGAYVKLVFSRYIDKQVEKKEVMYGESFDGSKKLEVDHKEEAE